MNDIISITAPSPTVRAEFHVERHPDPIVQALIDEVIKLRKECDALRAKLQLSEPIGAAPWR